MTEQDSVVVVQAATFGSKWTTLNNFLARIRYDEASPLRVLLDAFKRHHVGALRSPSVLDYGFGHAHPLFYFKQSAKIFGVELSERAIQSAAQRARKRAYSHFEFKRPGRTDSVRIDFPSDHFDIIICSHTLEHVYDDEGLLSELRRVLRPKGRAFLLVPMDVDEPAIHRHKDERRNPDFPEKSFHVWRYNLETFTWLVEKAGFFSLEAHRLDAIMHWRLSLGRLAQVAFSLLTALLPFCAWAHLDQLAEKRGYRSKQCLVVCTKS